MLPVVLPCSVPVLLLGLLPVCVGGRGPRRAIGLFLSFVVPAQVPETLLVLGSGALVLGPMVVAAGPVSLGSSGGPWIVVRAFGGCLFRTAVLGAVAVLRFVALARLLRRGYFGMTFLVRGGAVDGGVLGVAAPVVVASVPA